jgi:hypothetical protein
LESEIEKKKLNKIKKIELLEGESENNSIKQGNKKLN